MRRLRRGIHLCALGLSLAVFAAAVGLWAWSHHRGALVIDGRSPADSTGWVWRTEGGAVTGYEYTGRVPDALHRGAVWGPSRVTAQRSFVLFRVWRTEFLLPRTAGAVRPVILGTVRSVQVPIRGPLALATAYPVASVVLAIASGRRRRRDQGLCPACGYDLRASPERCPECGTVREAVSEPAGPILPPSDVSP